MRVCLYLDRGGTLRWHSWLAQTLRKSGNDVHVRFSPKKLTMPRGYASLFTLEKAFFREVSDRSATDEIQASVLSPVFTSGLDEPFDAVVNLACDFTAIPLAKRVLTPAF